MYMYVYIIVTNVCDIFSVACLKLSLTPSIVTINLHMVVETFFSTVQFLVTLVTYTCMATLLSVKLKVNAMQDGKLYISQ